MGNVKVTIKPRDKYRTEISIREIERPRGEVNPEKDMEWICECLGLADNNDDLAMNVFKELVKASRENKGVSSKQIMEKNKVTQGAVVYHLNTFMRSGLAVKQGRFYILRRSNLDRTMEELEQDMLHRMERMRKIAKLIDERF